MIDKWTCHICGDNRPDSCISVFSRDVSSKYKLPSGTIKENIRYCNDKEECIKRAKTFSFLKKEKI